MNRDACTGVAATALMLAFGAAAPAFAGPANDTPGERAAGQVTAVLRYCAKLDPRLAESADRTLRVLTRTSGTAPGSDAFRAEFDRLTELLQQSNQAQLLHDCSGALRVKSGGHDKERG